jgi:hypothetical protein
MPLTNSLREMIRSAWRRVANAERIGVTALVRLLGETELATCSAKEVVERRACCHGTARMRLSNCASLDIIRSGDVIRQNNDRCVVRCAFHGLSNRREILLL